MGCCSSSFKPNSAPGQGANAVAVAGLFGFTQNDLNAMYSCFKRCDMQKDATVNIDEFCVMSQLEDQEKIAGVVFRLFDKDHSHALDFTEFMCAMYSVCSCDRANLAHLVFELFDSDGGGEMDRGEIKTMLKLLYNMKPPKTADIAVRDFDNSRDGKIDAKEFVSHALHNEVLIVPLFNMQMTLRRLILGTSRWEELSHSRTKKYGTNSIFSILSKTADDAKRMKAASLVMAHDIASTHGDPSDVHPNFKAKAEHAKKSSDDIKAAAAANNNHSKHSKHKHHGGGGGKVLADK